MTDNQNFEKDINVPHKEQIIIDGVDVSGCSVYKKGKCLISKAKCNARCDYGAIYLKEQLFRKTQECEELKKQLMQKDEVNTFFNTPIEGWSSNPCDICESKNNYEQLKQECEELKKLKDEVYKENKRIRKLLALEKPLIEILSNIDIIVSKFRCNQKEDKYINIFGDIKRIVKAIDEFNNNNVQNPTLEVLKFNKILETNKYEQALDEIFELENENKNIPQYRGICQSIWEIINNAKDINIPTQKECNNE